VSILAKMLAAAFAATALLGTLCAICYAGVRVLVCLHQNGLTPHLWLVAMWIALFSFIFAGMLRKP